MEGDHKPGSNPNRAPDHLANERTDLAWMRTTVALMGFDIVKLRYLSLPAQRHGLGWELGLVFAVAGLLMVPLATWHYFQGAEGPRKRRLRAGEALDHRVQFGCLGRHRRAVLPFQLLAGVK